MNVQTESAMGKAFAKAGVRTAEQRLSDLALSAMVTHADDTMEAIEQDRIEQEDQRRINREEQSRKDQEYRDYLASWHKTPLRDMMVGDKPIWQVSAGTIRAWLPTQHKKMRAVEMLIEGLPEDGRPLEYYRRPEDVKEVWRILSGSEDEGRA